MDQARWGILLRLAAGLCYTGMAICVKELDNLPLGQVVFFRSFFALLPLLIFLRLRGELPGGLATRRPVGHLLRSTFGALAMFASFATLVRLPIAEATLISYLAPPLMAVFAAIFLRETLTPMRVAAVLLGLAGVVVLVLPDINLSGANSSRLAGYALGVLTAVLSASALTMVRSLARTESPGAIALYFVIASMLAALLTIGSGWVRPDGTALALLVASGVFGGLAHIATTMAFRYAEASALAPLDYVSLLWAALADVLIFSATLNWTFAPALVLVLTAAALMIIEETNRAKLVRRGC